MSHELLWEAFKSVKYGTLSIIMPDKSEQVFKGPEIGYDCQLQINDLSCIDAVITGGDVGFGETYIQNTWDTNNLANLLSFMVQNSESLEVFFHAKKLKALMLYFSSLLKRNTLKGSKKNIEKHYDLGDDFYKLWLDNSMTYSSAYFGGKSYDLSRAQEAKYKNILDKLHGKTILEIGCGWGGFAEQAARSGYEINCLTISQKQCEYATKRLKNFDKAKIQLQDYRKELGTYDNIVSIEMFEAVGQKYWNKYFEILNKSLAANGKAVLQIITIDEEVFNNYQKRVDFIQKHIFPGGILPPKSKIRQLSKTYGFKIVSELDFGNDYEKTLKIWLNNFENKKSQIKDLGFSEEFIRKWRFYLSYCIAGFNSKRTSVVQFELEKSN